MKSEQAWVETIKRDIGPALSDQCISVETRVRLPYAVHVTGYRSRRGKATLADPQVRDHPYQTDFLIAETHEPSGVLVPRVVVEFKLGKVTTHDALTYSTKAGTHKNIHPYLRYGIVIGDFPKPLPNRLLRHGHQFDFMMTLPSKDLSDEDRRRLIKLLKQEVKASRTLSKLLLEKSNFSLLHRNLVAK